MEQIIKVVEVEGGFQGSILIKDREQTSLFFSSEEWTKEQIVRRLSRYLSKASDDNK